MCESARVLTMARRKGWRAAGLGGPVADGPFGVADRGQRGLGIRERGAPGVGERHQTT